MSYCLPYRLGQHNTRSHHRRRHGGTEMGPASRQCHFIHVKIPAFGGMPQFLLDAHQASRCYDISRAVFAFRHSTAYHHLNYQYDAGHMTISSASTIAKYFISSARYKAQTGIIYQLLTPQ